MRNGDLWRTPQQVIDYIESRFGKIKLDLCGSDEGHVCDFYLVGWTHVVQLFVGQTSGVLGNGRMGKTQMQCAEVVPQVCPILCGRPDGSHEPLIW